MRQEGEDLSALDIPADIFAFASHLCGGSEFDRGEDEAFRFGCSAAVAVGEGEGAGWWGGGGGGGGEGGEEVGGGGLEVGLDAADYWERGRK